MPSPKSKTSATEALAILSTVALTSFVFAMLYFARAVLIPLALAALLTFLLAPLVSRGQPIGSLCLLDTKPRPFTTRDQRHLQEYGREVMVEIAKRAPQSTSADVPIAL